MSIRTEVGFASSQSLVSDVEPAIRAAKHRVARRVDAKPNVDVSNAQGQPVRVRATATVAPPQASQPPKRKVRWVKAGVMVAGLWLVIAVIAGSRSHPESSAYSAPSYETSTVEPQAQAVSAPPAVLSEVVPPPGGGDRVLGTAEIRYCLAEEIRMDAAQAVSSGYTDAQINLYNWSVDDFNDRCGNYRYRTSEMMRARGEVERRRSVLESEGRARF